MKKIIDVELKWWELSYWPDGSSKEKYDAKISFNHKENTISSGSRFKTRKEALEWIDSQLTEVGGDGSNE